MDPSSNPALRAWALAISFIRPGSLLVFAASFAAAKQLLSSRDRGA